MRTAVASLLAIAFAGCASDGRELRDPLVGLPETDVTTEPTPPPSSSFTMASASAGSPVATALVTTTTSTTTDAGPITIDRLFSPANATAEMSGTGARPDDLVTVDEMPAEVVSFEIGSDGGFVVQVRIVDEGAHTVCVADSCGRVYTLAPDAESPDEVIAKIEAAIPAAAVYVAFDDRFPEWQLEIGGALAGTGGSADLETKTVTIYRNRGRDVDDFVRSILHEYGHVADFELLDDDERVTYREIRGIDPTMPWVDTESHVIDDWGSQPSEDFAEVMAMIWSDGLWSPRTDGLASAPTVDELDRIRTLVLGDP